MVLQQNIIDFRKRYGLQIRHSPGFVDSEQVEYRLGHINEEVAELARAIKAEDLVEVADALTDICYVSIGTALTLGINFQACWDEVHRSNMAKQRAKPDGSDSKRGSGLDVVKPPGWESPNIERAMWVPISETQPILLRAHDIIDNRTEERERQYGSITENCEHAAQIAGIMQNKDFTKSDVLAVLAALKLARHRRSYKQDSLLDACAYLGAMDNLFQEEGDDRGN